MFMVEVRCCSGMAVEDASGRRQGGGICGAGDGGAAWSWEAAARAKVYAGANECARKAVMRVRASA